MKLDLIGERFGRLFVERESPVRRHHAIMWECRCDCGKAALVRSSHLRYGVTKSCGCFAKEQRRKAIALPAGQSAFNRLLRDYRTGAASRGYVWALTDAQARTLFAGKCHYCGVEPAQPYPKGKWGDAYNDRILVNGIDRIDNLRGYTSSNSVSCCKVCNRAKSAMLFADFEAWLLRLVNLNRHKGMQ